MRLFHLEVGCDADDKARKPTTTIGAWGHPMPSPARVQETRCGTTPPLRTCEEGGKVPVLPPAPSSSDPGSSQVLAVFSHQYLGTFITVSVAGYRVVRESHRRGTGSIVPQRSPHPR